MEIKILNRLFGGIKKSNTVKAQTPSEPVQEKNESRKIETALEGMAVYNSVLPKSKSPNSSTSDINSNKSMASTDESKQNTVNKSAANSSDTISSHSSDRAVVKEQTPDILPLTSKQKQGSDVFLEKGTTLYSTSKDAKEAAKLGFACFPTRTAYRYSYKENYGEYSKVTDFISKTPISEKQSPSEFLAQKDVIPVSIRYLDKDGKEIKAITRGVQHPFENTGHFSYNVILPDSTNTFEIAQVPEGTSMRFYNDKIENSLTYCVEKGRQPEILIDEPCDFEYVPPQDCKSVPSEDKKVLKAEFESSIKELQNEGLFPISDNEITEILEALS